MVKDQECRGYLSIAAEKVRNPRVSKGERRPAYDQKGRLLRQPLKSLEYLL